MVNQQGGWGRISVIISQEFRKVEHGLSMKLKKLKLQILPYLHMALPELHFSFWFTTATKFIPLIITSCPLLHYEP
jgi:hypothetical protein